MILILSGLPASGKSTIAKRWVEKDPTKRVRVNYDDLRLEMYGEGWKFNREGEDKMKLLARDRAALALAEGKDVVIDNLNLTEGARAPWIKLAKKYDIPFELLEIDTPISTCVARDMERKGKARVGRAVIDWWALTTGHIDWNYYHGKFVIVDMDGTLADCSERQQHLTTMCLKCGKPEMTTLNEHGMKICVHCGNGGECSFSRKDWAAFFRGCENDPPRQTIVDLVGQLDPIAYRIIIVSGRPQDQCGIATEDWLNTHLRYHRYIHLFMRKGGDHRSDVEVKQEILDYLPKERIAFVIDDRPSVIRMWRANGLTTLDVGNGEEF